MFLTLLLCLLILLSVFSEDNLINQKMMVMLLRKLGYEILVASNGREALNLLETEARKGRAFEIECILMDASMVLMKLNLISNSHAINEILFDKLMFISVFFDCYFDLVFSGRHGRNGVHALHSRAAAASPHPPLHHRADSECD